MEKTVSVDSIINSVHSCAIRCGSFRDNQFFCHLSVAIMEHYSMGLQMYLYICISVGMLSA